MDLSNLLPWNVLHFKFVHSEKRKKLTNRRPITSPKRPLPSPQSSGNHSDHVHPPAPAHNAAASGIRICRRNPIAAPTIIARPVATTNMRHILLMVNTGRDQGEARPSRRA